MLSDITIGQYFPGSSVIHRLDPRFKIIITGLFIIMLFSADGFIGMGISAAFMLMAYLMSGIPIKLMLKSMKPIIPVILFTSVLNLFFIEGVSVFSIWKLNITDEGLRTTAYMMIRIIELICGSSLLTYTTSPIILTDAVESLLSPLAKLHFPVHELAMMMTIAMRFIPTLIEETDKIMSAQKARGADMESGNIIQRAKALVPILIPLFVSAFRRAEELALAMECRCYRGGEGRTRLNRLSSTGADYVAVGVTMLFISAVYLVNAVTG
ncbi:MAG: energy-coupling factor transporter transmembrane protein EcfT [Oscillospiraceae bacterium]|nr:energy-coupling factor transporter transmembrane protein EcfT [Oscillospiraceae bacterium]MBQ5417893.1 energy-coupling factor transporter transmembrane protein EcfT [Oscillospiraceae bacterium]